MHIALRELLTGHDDVAGLELLSKIRIYSSKQTVRPFASFCRIVCVLMMRVARGKRLFIGNVISELPAATAQHPFHRSPLKQEFPRIRHLAFDCRCGHCTWTRY